SSRLPSGHSGSISSAASVAWYPSVPRRESASWRGRTCPGLPRSLRAATRGEKRCWGGGWKKSPERVRGDFPLSRFQSSICLRVALPVLTGAIALYAGFLYFTPEGCARLVRAVGYWWMFALLGAAVATFAWCVRSSDGWHQFAGRVWPGRA